MVKYCSVIVLGTLSLAACDERATDSATGSAVAKTLPSSPVGQDTANRFRTRVAEFCFELILCPAKDDPMAVVLSVSGRQPSPDVRQAVVRISEAEAGRLIDWLEGDGLFMRGELNRRALLKRPDRPFFSLVAALSRYDAYFEHVEANDATRLRLKRLSNVLGAPARDRIRELIQGQAPQGLSTLKAAQRNTQRPDQRGRADQGAADQRR